MLPLPWALLGLMALALAGGGTRAVAERRWITEGIRRWRSPAGDSEQNKRRAPRTEKRRPPTRRPGAQGHQSRSPTADVPSTDPVARWGRSSVSPFVADRDIETIELAGGRAAAGCVIRGRWAVTIGDVVAPPELSGSALDEYLELLAARRLRPVFVATATAEDYQRRGLRTMAIADDPVIDLARFTLAGARMASLRHSVTSAERSGLWCPTTPPWLGG
jgi:hypothetical protein